MPELFDVATYDYTKVQNVADIPATYTQVAKLVTPSREEGVYEIGMSLTAKYDQSNKSMYLRFSLDEGVSWTEFISEPSAKTDDKPMLYVFPKERIEGIFDMQIEARKQDSSGLFSISFIDLWYKRVGNIA